MFERCIVFYNFAHRPPTSASKGSDLRAMKYDELRAIINTSTG